MGAKVTLKVKENPFSGEELVVNTSTKYMVGRADDCTVRMPPGVQYQTVSRHHCLLEIDPPHVQVRDLGSRNGTYVNGRLIGRRTDPDIPNPVPDLSSPGFELGDGDEIELGPLAIEVGISPPKDSEELLEMPEGEEAFEPDPGVACPHSQGVW